MRRDAGPQIPGTLIAFAFNRQKHFNLLRATVPFEGQHHGLTGQLPHPLDQRLPISHWFAIQRDNAVTRT